MRVDAAATVRAMILQNDAMLWACTASRYFPGKASESVFSDALRADLLPMAPQSRLCSPHLADKEKGCPVTITPNDWDSMLNPAAWNLGHPRNHADVRSVQRSAARDPHATKKLRDSDVVCTRNPNQKALYRLSIIGHHRSGQRGRGAGNHEIAPSRSTGALPAPAPSP
jgi:hypothetical protein